MNPILESLYQPTAKWEEVVSILQKQLEELPVTAWKPVLPNSAPAGHSLADQVEADLLKEHRTYVPEVVSSVVSWFRNGKWPTLHDPASYYLKRRLVKALWFLEGMVLKVDDTRETIFPFPQGTPHEVALWFLTDWWFDYGLREWMSEAIRQAENSARSAANERN